MTGTELLTLVRILIAERTEADTLDTEIQVLLNVALDKWISKICESNCRYYIKSGTATITADSRTATLPSDCTGKVSLMDDPNSYPILEKDFVDFKADDTGNPKKAAIVGPNTIYFETAPGSNYTVTLYYYYRPTAIDVEDDSTEIVFPKNHHALLAYETAVTIRLAGESVSLQEMMAERQDLRQTLQNEIDSRRIDGTLPVQSRVGQVIDMSRET